MTDTPQCPECEKLEAVAEQSQTIGEFLEWLTGERELVIAEWVKQENWAGQDTSELHPCPATQESLLAEFFGVDLKKVETERRALLTHLREAADD